LSGDFQDIRDERRKAASRCALQDAEAERRRADTAETEVKQAQLQLDEQERQLEDEVNELSSLRTVKTCATGFGIPRDWADCQQRACSTRGSLQMLAC
ncbi:unnamed protein product, partial [Polarella glacialis]